MERETNLLNTGNTDNFLQCLKLANLKRASVVILVVLNCNKY